jgi:Xaa-Pro aminopeptidase
MIKSKIKIENIRKASKITDECFSFILSKIHPGITEADIAEKIETFIKNRNAFLAFLVIAAFGKNTGFVHYLLSKKSSVRCRKNEIILLDFGAKVNGYCSDMTRMIFVGKPKKEWIYAYNTVLNVQLTIIDAIKKPS